jgi:N-acyl-D-amino-acid deacylase
MRHQLAVRGGVVVDGTGSPSRRVDVGIDDGVITELAPTVRGESELDASGRIVTPGFVDLHTHYDPQVLWDPWLTPSSHLGVTSVVAGNCGFSIAPCRPEMRGSMMRTLESVEDMRVPTLAAGIDWSFESYGEYLARVSARGTAINFGGYVGHTAVRIWVMGDDAYEREATDDEVAQMRAVVAESLQAGAIGFSSDRSPFHRGDGGRPVPSAVASQAELEALMLVTRDIGRGIVHVAPGESFHWLYDFQGILGRPVTWTSILTYPRDSKARAFWGDKLAFHQEGMARGADVHPQITCRPITTAISMLNPTVFAMVPAWGEVIAVDERTRRARYADAAWRARAAAELESGTYVNPRWDNFSVSVSPRRPDLAGRTIASLVAERGVNPVEVLVSIAEEDDYATLFEITFANDEVDGVATLLASEGTVLGLSDAGAHAGQLCDAALPVDFLATWVRDRGVVSLERGVHRVSGEIAQLLQLTDRGTLVLGKAADVVVLDLDTLDPGPTRRIADLPGDGERLVSDRPTGLVHVLVNGVAIRQDGHMALASMDTLPGTILANA